MPTYRSALGKNVDMTRLAAQNEHVRAVGNLKVNARGDTIDENNKVVVPVTKKVGDSYQKTVSNRAANIVRRKNQEPVVQENVIQEPVQNTFIEPSYTPLTESIQEELHPDELEFENDIDDIELEKIKSQENFVIKPADEAPDFVKPQSKKK